MKSGYTIRRTKTGYKMTYHGDLGEAIEKAQADRKKLINDEEIKHWKWLAKIAEKKVQKHEDRIIDLGRFISAAIETKKEQEQERKEENEG